MSRVLDEQTPPTSEDLAHSQATCEAVLRALLGDEEYERFLAFSSDAENHVLAQKHVIAALDAAFEKLRGQEDVLEQRLAPLLPDLLRVQTTTRRGFAHDKTLQTEPAKSLVAFLTAAKAALGDARYTELTTDIYRDGLFKVLVQLEASSNYAAADGMLLQLAVEQPARTLCHAIEGWYKQVLLVLMRLTHEMAGSLPPQQPRWELGRLMEYCKQLWSSTWNLQPVLDHDLRRFRNAFAHEGHEPEVRDDMVSLAWGSNRLRMTRHEWAAFVRRHFAKLATLWIAFLAMRSADVRGDAT